MQLPSSLPSASLQRTRATRNLDLFNLSIQDLAPGEVQACWQLIEEHPSVSSRKMALQALPSASHLALPEEYIASLKRLLVVLERRKNTGKNESKEEAALIATTAARLSLSIPAEDMNELSSQFDDPLSHSPWPTWLASAGIVRS